MKVVYFSVIAMMTVFTECNHDDAFKTGPLIRVPWRLGLLLLFAKALLVFSKTGAFADKYLRTASAEFMPQVWWSCAAKVLLYLFLGGWVYRFFRGVKPETEETVPACDSSPGEQLASRSPARKPYWRNASAVGLAAFLIVGLLALFHVRVYRYYGLLLLLNGTLPWDEGLASLLVRLFAPPWVILPLGAFLVLAIAGRMLPRSGWPWILAWMTLAGFDLGSEHWWSLGVTPALVTILASGAGLIDLLRGLPHLGSGIAFLPGLGMLAFIGLGSHDVPTLLFALLVGIVNLTLWQLLRSGASGGGESAAPFRECPDAQPKSFAGEDPRPSPEHRHPERIFSAWQPMLLTLAIVSQVPMEFAFRLRMMLFFLAFPGFFFQELLLILAIGWLLTRVIGDDEHVISPPPAGNKNTFGSSKENTVALGFPACSSPDFPGNGNNLPEPSHRARRLFGAALVGFFGILVAAAFVDWKVFALMDTRLSYGVWRFAGNLDIAWGSIAPQISVFFLGCLMLTFWAFWRDCRDAMAATPGSVRLAIPLPAAFGVLMASTMVPFVFHFATGEISHSLPLNVAGSVSEQISLRLRPVPADLVPRLGRLAPFPAQIQEVAPPEYKNVILIVAESFHVRYLSLYGFPESTTPRLEQYRPHMRLFTRMHCCFPGTENAMFSLLHGLYATEDMVWDTNPAFSCPSLIKVLKEHRYKTSYFYSGRKDFRNFSTFLAGSGFDEVFDQQNMPDRDHYPLFNWGLDEQCTRNAIIRQINRHGEKDERFFLVYLPVTPHHPFDNIDTRFRRFKPTFQEDLAGKSDISKYKNQVLFMDSIFGDILDTLASRKMLDSTLVVLVGDHGEALGELGFAGHGFYTLPHLTNVLCAIVEPGRTAFQQDDTLCSHIDLMPTILDLLNIPMPTGKLYQGCSVFSPSRLDSRYVLSCRERARLSSPRYYREAKNGDLQVYAPVATFGKGLPADFDEEQIASAASDSARCIADLHEFHELQNLFLRNYGRGTFP